MSNGELLKGYVNSSMNVEDFNKEKPNYKKIGADQEGASIFNKNQPSTKFEKLVEKGSEMFKEMNKDYQIKRDERLRKEIEEKSLTTEIEDEIVEAFQTAGKNVVKGIKSLFGRKEQENII